jgi:hypothetical protein
MAVLLVVACGGSTQQQVVGPSGGGRCQMSLATPASLPAVPTQVTVELSTTRDCTWSAQTSADWLHVEPAAGQGPATMIFTAAANPQGRQRSATVAINDQQFTLMQEGAPCTFEVTPAIVSIGHQGGRVSLQVTTLEGCSWTTQSSQPWARVVTGSGGEASGALELAIDSNTGPERSAVLTLATVVVVVNQSAGPNDRTECRFSLSPGSRRIPAAGGAATFSVSTQAGCAWSAASNQPWIAIVSSANVVGSTTVTYRVDPNLSPSVRSGVITAGTRRHVVQQDAGPPP